MTHRVLRVRLLVLWWWLMVALWRLLVRLLVRLL